MTKLFSWVRGGAVAAALAGALLQSRPAAAFVDCTVSGCGGNTPVLFGTPIIGLNFDGKINGRGVRIVSALQRVGPLVKGVSDCPAGARLSLDRGELVGMVGNAKACSGDSLIGMAFWIEVPTQPCVLRDQAEPGPVKSPSRVTLQQKRTPIRDPFPGSRDLRPCKPDGPAVQVQLRIDEHSEVQTWEVEHSSAVPTYRLVWNQYKDRDNAMTAGQFSEIGGLLQQSICPLRQAWMETWQLTNLETGNDCKDPGKVRPSAAMKRTWYDSTDHVLLTQGETYLADGAIDRARVGAPWFNVACVGSAIAKTRLLGFDPMAESPMPNPAAGGPLTRAQRARQATLKMLTGRYRGLDSFTSPGMPLMWKQPGGPSYYGEPVNWSESVIESYWDENGAICLTHRRTWRAPAATGGSPLSAAMPEGIWFLNSWVWFLPYEDVEKFAVKAISSRLGVPLCGAPPSRYIWVTYPVDHVAH
jgi:ADYC domain